MSVPFAQFSQKQNDGPEDIGSVWFLRIQKQNLWSCVLIETSLVAELVLLSAPAIVLLMWQRRRVAMQCSSTQVMQIMRPLPPTLCFGNDSSHTGQDLQASTRVSGHLLVLWSGANIHMKSGLHSQKQHSSKPTKPICLACKHCSVCHTCESLIT